MTKRTRYFLLGSAAVLVAGLCTGLVAFYGSFATGAGAAAPTALSDLRYVPQNSTLVAFADVREIMSSEFRQHFRNDNESAGQQEFEKMTGIDVERDVDSVLASMAPSEVERGGFVLVRGRFDQSKLEAFAAQKQALTTTYRGKKLITPPKELNGKDEPVIAFLETGLIGIGDDVSIRRAVDTGEGAQNITGNASMMSLVGDAQGSGNAWAVGLFEALRAQAKLPDAMSQQIPPIEAFALAGRFNGGLSGSFRAVAADEKAAQDLREVAQGLLALLRLQSGSKQELQPLLQSLQLGGTGTSVVLSFVIPPQLLDSFVPAMKNPGIRQ